MVWIPPQQQQTKEYVRWTSISAFAIFMLWLVSLFYDEYRGATLLQSAANQALAQIEEHNKKVDELEKQVITKQIKIKHRTVTLPNGTRLCTDPAEGARTGCKIVTDDEIERIISRKTIYAYKDKAVSDEPTGGSAPKPVATDTDQPKVTERVVTKTITEKPEIKDSKIEIDAGLVKIAMSNEASWTAIFKIVFTLLFTFFGVKLINFGFRKLEGPAVPA